MARFKKDFDWSQIEKDQEAEEEIIYVSKSEIKRDAQDYRRIAASFVDLNHSRLLNLGFDDKLLHTIQKARSLSNEAKRREISYVAKQLRAYDLEELQQILQEATPTHKTSTDVKIDKQVRVTIERLLNPNFNKQALDLLSEQLSDFNIGHVKELLKEYSEGSQVAFNALYDYFYNAYRLKFN